MEYVHAAILLYRAGKPINEENLTKVLSAAGINADPIRVKALVASLAEVNIEEAIKFSPASVMATPAPAPVAAPTPTPTPGEKPEEAKKKKEEEEKKKEEAAMEGLGALFG